MQIEFITSSRIAGYSDHHLYNFILNQVLQDKIVVLEKELDYQQQMELIAMGLEKTVTDRSVGIKFMPFFVTTQVAGLIRQKQQEVQFNLIAPGTTNIAENDEGHISVTTQEGEVFSAGF
jgi:hypothetical protein